MGTETLSCRIEYPRPKKKSRQSDESVQQARWARLPDVVLHEVFARLRQEDRVSAASTCRSWRRALYHPLWWKNMTFSIEPKKLTRARFLCSTFGNLVTNATIRFDSLSTECVREFLALMSQLSENCHLRSLVIEPRYCRIGPLTKDGYDDVKQLVNLMKECCRRPLKRFSIGVVDELAQHVPEFLKLLAMNEPEQVEQLGLASIKEEPGNYRPFTYDVKLFKPFTKLQVLSVDYDIVSDLFLRTLENASDLKRLVVHVNGAAGNHPGTTNDAWSDFRAIHPACELRLTLVHAYQEVYILDEILKKNMPLSHLKVFFCEYINMEALNLLSSWYTTTLRSVIYVDSQSDDPDGNSWNIVRAPVDPRQEVEPDPFVMMAWLCTRLEEIVLLGYKYMEDELVAIARLRGSSLKVLDVGHNDVQYEPSGLGHLDLKRDIAEILQKPWAPLKSKQLHPIIRDPSAGDSDEYLLPIVLSDIRMN